ncbi:hypothetical protein KKC91_11945 [bacterium]|nr:hypothetical protein [bacterium]MBU1852674.1 hypothetical protein [Candidatus Omnitrophota bacterium]
MKKIVVIIIFFLIAVFFFNAEAKAEFTIQVDRYSIDFGNLDLGEVRSDVPSDGLEITCTSDLGNPWELRISNIQPLVHVYNPTQFIPDTNFRWYSVSTTGGGVLESEEKDFTQERVIYSAPLGEGTTGTRVVVKFKLIVPQMVQAGRYETRIIITMTE